MVTKKRVRSQRKTRRERVHCQPSPGKEAHRLRGGGMPVGNESADTRCGASQSHRYQAHLLATPSPGQGCSASHSYLLCRDHGDHVHPLLPHHLPEVMAGMWQGSLSGDVVPFRPTNHHLQGKGRTSKPGWWNHAPF